MRILFGITFFATVVLVHVYVWRRLVRDTGLRGRARTAGTAAVIGFGLCFPSAFLATRYVSGGLAAVLAWPAYLWIGAVFYALLVLWAADLIRLGRWLVRRARGRAADPLPDPGRRELLARAVAGTAATAALGAGVFGVRRARGAIDVVEVPVVLPRLPPALDGFSIVQLTDLHVGGTVGAAFVEDLVDRANAVRPDLIALTGDLADGTPSTVGGDVASLAELRARYGVCYVTGNHEYYAGVEPWLAEVRRLGVRVLRNERISIGDGADSFDLAGVDDFNAARFGGGHGADLSGALAGRDPRRELVLLAHQPRQIDEAARLGVGLQLSGHTHGGQIWPWHYVVGLQQRGHIAGLERVGDAQLYTSRGCGYWGPPMRIGAPPEITRIVLRSA